MFTTPCWTTWECIFRRYLSGLICPAILRPSLWLLSRCFRLRVASGKRVHNLEMFLFSCKSTRKEFFSPSFGQRLGSLPQRSSPWTDDGHGWVRGDPPSVIRTGWYRWSNHPIRHPHPLRMGFVPEKTKKTPIRTDGISVSKPPIRHPDRMVQVSGPRHVWTDRPLRYPQNG
jgi:hypothetical protein